MDEKIKAEYYNPKSGFWDARKIWKKLKAKGEKVELADVERVIDNQALTQMFKPLPNKYKKEYRSINVPSTRFQFQVDLLDMSKYVAFNRNYKWIMNCVDVYSRYATSVPMKSKELKSVIPAFKEVVKRMGVPQNLNTDLEPAMMGEAFSNYLATIKTKHWKNDPELKRNNAIVERYNRTLREVLQKYFYSRDTKNWIDILDDITSNYNTTNHSTTKQTPQEVWSDKAPNRQKLSLPLPQKFKVGDVVRILKYHSNFTKRSDAKKFTKNLYTIIEVVGNTYMLRNEKGVRQRRKAFEIQKVDPDTVENVKIDPKGEGKEFKKEVKKQQAQRRLNKADIGNSKGFVEQKPLDAKRKRKKKIIVDV